MLGAWWTTQLILDQCCFSFRSQSFGLHSESSMTAFYMEWKLFFFPKSNIKSIIKHWKEIEKKWIIYYTSKEKEFVDTLPEFYLIIFSFMQSFVWNFLKIKIHARLPKVREKCIFYLTILITGHNGIIECSFPRNYVFLTQLTHVTIWKLFP